jgi:hypothetical protein
MFNFFAFYFSEEKLKGRQKVRRLGIDGRIILK